MKNEEYYHVRPKTTEEDKLIDQGWEYVRFDERLGSRFTVNESEK
jgi:hypothetical protein